LVRQLAHYHHYFGAAHGEDAIWGMAMKYIMNCINVATILLLILWGVLISCSPRAHAKDKITPRERVAEAFALVPYFSPRPPKPAPAPHRGRVMRMIVPYYIYDHWTAFAPHGNAGKLWIVRECSVDIQQDPGETSCKMTWAKI
jgi:hypothetical protein